MRYPNPVHQLNSVQINSGKRRILSMAVALAVLCQACAAFCSDWRFSTIGIYIDPPAPGDKMTYRFMKASGYNYLEFCDWGVGKRPDKLPEYYAKMNTAIDAAHRKGFKVWILLLAGMRQWQGPAEEGSAGTFSALDAGLLRERLQYIEQAVKLLPAADGFEFFAGDPGGDPQGRSTIKDCMDFAGAVQNIVRQRVPRAGFIVNLWAVAEWDGFPSPLSLEFWRKQVKLSRAVAEDNAMLGPDCGVAFSLDNYYRSLTLTCYADAGLEPELYPAAADVAALRRKGVKHILGWPYFLVDEVDDGFIKPNNVESGGQSQAEARYIRKIVSQARELKLDGLVSNAFYTRAEALNIYVFGQMCQKPELSPEAALDDWAGIIADNATKGDLRRVLRFIENHSNWQNSLPPACRLPDMRCENISTAATAIEVLGRVVPRAKPAMPLLEPPAAYLARLRQRLDAIAAGKIGGVNPIVRSASPGSQSKSP